MLIKPCTELYFKEFVHKEELLEELKVLQIHLKTKIEKGRYCQM